MMLTASLLRAAVEACATALTVVGIGTVPGPGDAAGRSCAPDVSETAAHASDGRTAVDTAALEGRMDSDVWLPPDGRLEVHVNREPDPSRERLAIFIGDTDWTGLFSMSSTTFAYQAGPVLFPGGESPLVVYAVSPENQWRVIAQGVLRVKTPGGFERAEVAPRFSVDNKGQLTEHHRPVANAPARATFQDVTVNGGLRSTHVRGSVSTSTEIDFVGVSNRPEALRFGTEGAEAPKFDVASYRVRVEGQHAAVTVGHVPLNLHRHLINEFASRGVSTTLRINRTDVTLAALNGNSIVGFGNLLGLNNRQNQIRLLMVGTDFIKARPRGARLELVLTDGSVLPRSGFTQGRIADAEAARGGGVRFVGSSRDQRARVDAGYARSRFTNVPDPLVAGDTPLVPLRARTNDAQYVDAGYDVVKGKRLAGSLMTNLSATYRFERVEPLFRTIGRPQAVAADVISNTLEITGGLGPAIGQISHAASHDNLHRISSILTTFTQVTNATVVVPISAFRRTDRLTPGLPTVSYTLNYIVQAGEGLPANGGFASLSQVPDQRSGNHVVRCEWIFGTVRAGYSQNLSHIDNRQPGRETADFDTVAHQVTFGFTGNNLDLALDLAADRALNLEQGAVTRTLRIGFNGTWRITTNASIASILGRTSVRDVSVSRNSTIDASVQYTHTVPLRFPRRGSPKIRVFTRWSWQSADLVNRLFLLNDRHESWTANSGISLGLF
jgi:hypothetical protein